MDNKKLAERVEREKKFHDERFFEDSREEQTGIFYKAIESWYKDYNDLSMRKGVNSCLELGAGIESVAFVENFEFDLLSIDISDVAVEFLNKMETSNSATLEVADAHRLTYDENSFDRIIGRGILHHLDLSLSISEAQRVLINKGQIVFGEPLAGNPLINFYRLLTPSIRSEDEQPLRHKDIKYIQQSFSNVSIVYYGFFTLIFAVLRLPTSGLAKSMDDLFLNKLKMGRFLAWACIIHN